MFTRWVAALFAIAVPFLSLGGTASADQLHFRITSHRSETVRVEFSSTERTHFWPGNGKSWSLNESDSQTLNISCEPGEYICYGAWVEDDQTTFWGVGYQNSHRCTKCCWHCDGSSPVISLGY
jgi:hypothetical protein